MLSFFVDLCGYGETPSTKCLPSQTFVWAPPHGSAYWPRIVPAFESLT